jgi:polyhydroxybutyrate depolymerase
MWADFRGSGDENRREFDAFMSRRAFMCLILAACDGSTASLTADAPVDTKPSPDAAPTCGFRTATRGASNRTLTVAGLERTYIVYLPAGVDSHEPIPLVFVHHGYTMSAQAMFDITGYPALADQEHIALAFPDGQGGPNSLDAPWNVGANVCSSTNGAPPIATGDDFAMLDAIKADIALDQCIEPTHVYVTGFSMGGYFSHHAGCMRDDIRAVAPHSGGTHSLDGCTTQHKPIIMFHGRADTLIPVSCDDPTAAEAWAQKNGCASTAHEVSVDGGTCKYFDGCPADGQVALCTFPGMGHCWAGGQTGSVFACPTYASATALEWQFFKDYAW